jgi:hypothetical protein
LSAPSVWSGSPANVSWSATNAQVCTIKNENTNTVLSNATSGVYSLGNITEDTKVSAVCENSAYRKTSSSVISILKACSDSQVSKPTGLYLFGSAISNGVGPIDFNTTCSNVSIDNSTGNLSGYAWSGTVGWIKFDSSLNGPTPLPPASAGTSNYGAKYDTGIKTITGWARACAGMSDQTQDQSSPNNSCSGTTRTDGWDGWISFNGKAQDGTSYGVAKTKDPSANFSGYAWGSDVIGAIDFSNVVLGGYKAPPGPIKCTSDKNGIKCTDDIIKWCYVGNNSSNDINFPANITDCKKGDSIKITCIGPDDTSTSTAVQCLYEPPVPKPTPGAQSFCTTTAPVNYVNTQTTWSIANTANDIISDVTWTFVESGSQIKTSSSTVKKIYTTVGVKRIHAEGLIGVDPVSCNATTTIKLDTGGIHEI